MNHHEERLNLLIDEIKFYRFLAGFPPFSGATGEETWANLKNWQKVLRRPHYDRPEDRIFNLSDLGWSAITSYVLHDLYIRVQY